MRIDRLVGPFAETSPGRIAVDGPGESATYAQLDQLANRFAGCFRSQGVAAGDRVGVHVPRGVRSIAALLGALRVGAVCVPLDPSSPPARMKFIASDCGLQHVVISPALLSNWLAVGVCEPVRHFYLAADGSTPATPKGVSVHPWATIANASPAPTLACSASPDDLAYLLYTSGSTGTPKGVMISHRNALAFSEWAADTIALAPSDRVASVAPFHFDLSIFQLWATFYRGARLVVVDEGTVLSGRRMLDRIHEQGITVWYSVPSALILMLESGGLAERGAPSLRVVFFAGEVFPMRHLRRTMAALPKARFYNLFGPTETNVCLAHALEGIPAEAETAIPIGRPSCGDSITIVDEQGLPVADGEVGELLVDGPTVMLGYWNGGQPLLARHPYPTGDFVARSPSGDILYHGRRDHMVKIRGFRIELAEVESTLTQHPGISEAVAFAKEGQLVAAVLSTDPGLSVLAVKQHCAARLPPYMIPNDVRLLAQLPRTSSGKVDRVALQKSLADRLSFSSKSLVEHAPDRKP
jgi:amino acid adenylation domain-containing protein